MSTEPEPAGADPSSSQPSPRRRKFFSQFMMVARRTHLYVGLFLLPWVFLYGITGAMFNHQWLFPQVERLEVSQAVVDSSQLGEFPTPAELAQRVVEAINSEQQKAKVELAADTQAELTNAMMFEVNLDGQKHIVHLDPINQSSHIIKQPTESPQPKRLVPELKNIHLDPNPMSIGEDAAQHVLSQTLGTADALDPKPFGWTKLNFLASVDGEPARITYVLKDGHVDISRYEGHHGMTWRGFFLRLHTAHGQPPHWNGRMLWSFFVDAMAIAMVTWGCTGLLMWWQIKRTRVLGTATLIASVVCAGAMYWLMHHFYATTVL